MKSIKLKKKPSFYTDLEFSKWLSDDKLLAVIMDQQNRVEEVELDKKNYSMILRELKARHYI